MKATENKATCVIFDIDGTLVDSSAFESALFNAAVSEVLGVVSIRDAWNHYENVTDAGIVLEILQDNDLATMGHEQEIRARFGELVAGYLADGGACPEIRGARTLFDRLRRASGLEIGIATGGWAHTAKMKLGYSGFDVSDVPIASSDDHHHRVGIMNHCRSQIPSTPETIYIGDGEWDKQASEQLGWSFIGVGGALKGKCDRWVPDLSGILLEELR